MAQFASIFVFILFAALNGQSKAEVTGSIITLNIWYSEGGGAQYQIAFKNSGPKAVCGATYQLTLPNGTIMTDSWNMVPTAKNGQFVLPSWANIPAGGELTRPGFGVSGTGQPKIKIVSSTPCADSTRPTTIPPMPSTPAPPPAGVSVSIKTVKKWTSEGGGALLQAVVKNNGPNAVCGVTFMLTVPSAAVPLTMTDVWNMVPIGNNMWNLPNYANIPAGGQLSQPGFTISGSVVPDVSVVSTKPCAA